MLGLLGNWVGKGWGCLHWDREGFLFGVGFYLKLILKLIFEVCYFFLKCKFVYFSDDERITKGMVLLKIVYFTVQI